MATPPRMVELACPRCRSRHWEIDFDSRGSSLIGKPELSYRERIYACPACGEASTGYRVRRRSPPAFLLQPHQMHPMSTRAFARWLAIFRAAFPSDERLRTVGVFWYPGDGKDRQAERLHAAGAIGTVQGYRLWLSNRGPDDERIRVGVRKAGGPEESHFWCGSEIELDRCYFHVESSEIEVIRQLPATGRILGRAS